MYNGVKAMIHREIELSPKKEEEEVELCYAVDPKEDEDR